MGTIRVNGNNITAAGRDILVRNGRVIVDGQDVTPDAKEVSITVEGNVSSMSVDVCNRVEVKGRVEKIQTQSGDVVCGDVDGAVTTMSGDVNCGSVTGNVSTMSGDVICRKK